MNLKDEFETEWIDLVTDHNLTLEQGQACLDLHRRQFSRLLETYAARLAQSYDEDNR